MKQNTGKSFIKDEIETDETTTPIMIQSDWLHSRT